MLNLLVFAVVIWIIYTFFSYFFVIYPFHILLSLTKYLTWIGLGIVIIFLAWCFGDE